MSRKFEFHEAANIFPLLEGKDYDDFKEGIQHDGWIRHPIAIYQGKIVDGRNRYRAANDLGITCPIKKWDGKGKLIDFVIAENLHRRHLNESQRAMVAARTREIDEREAKERMQEGARKGGQKSAPGRPATKGQANLPDLITGHQARDAAGARLNVGGRTVDYATKVLRKGVVSLQRAVDTKLISVSAAADIVNLPVAEQREAVKAAREGERNTVAIAARKGKTSNRLHEQSENPKICGVGVHRGHEAINCLKKIPKNDVLRKRGFQIVSDFIRQNK